MNAIRSRVAYALTPRSLRAAPPSPSPAAPRGPRSLVADLTFTLKVAPDRVDDVTRQVVGRLLDRLPSGSVLVGHPADDPLDFRVDFSLRSGTSVDRLNEISHQLRRNVEEIAAVHDASVDDWQLTLR